MNRVQDINVREDLAPSWLQGQAQPNWAENLRGVRAYLLYKGGLISIYGMLAPQLPGGQVGRDTSRLQLPVTHICVTKA